VIVTVTPNPAIDQFYWVDEINEPDTALLTRANHSMSNAGGKGINISMLLKTLGADSTTMGFVAGYMGHAVEHYLHEKRISTNFAWTDGESRTNVVIIIKGKEISPLEVNADGPMISDTAQHRFLSRYQNALRRCESVILGGSLAPGLPSDFYKTLIQHAQQREIPAILFSSGDAFNQACELGPWIAKPDLRERSEVLGKPVETAEQSLAVGKELLETGSGIAIMAHTLSDPVAQQMVITQEGAWNLKARDAAAVNRVGAGDAFLAGLLFKLQSGKSIEEAAHYGMAASIASTESRSTTARNRSVIEQAKQRVEIESI
jgi:1-phosphofructokinase family hexose kinase